MINYYVRTAWRKLVNSKGYSFFNIAGLSLGIFGSIVIFQFVKYHVSTDTYHQKFKNIYRVVMDLHLDEGLEHEKGNTLFYGIKKFSTVENTAYIGQQEMTIDISTGINLPDKYLEKESAAFINKEYFKIFDYQWLAGSPSLLYMPNTAVLTEKYAKKYFGDGNPINRIMNINNKQDVKPWAC
jgi:putative ABC transport system permease protein